MSTKAPAPEAVRPPPRRLRLLPRSWINFAAAPPWMARLVFESALIVLSILLALAVDQWQRQRANEELAQQSLRIFEREIMQNKARLEDATPFHLGLHALLTQLDSVGQIETSADFRQLVGVEGFRPPALLETAWQTALATGTLTYMDFETVSALSLTYSLQRRFYEDTRAGVPNLIRDGTVATEEMPTAIRSTILYLDDLTDGEQELQAVYEQALMVIQQKIGRSGGIEAVASTPPP